MSQKSNKRETSPRDGLLHAHRQRSDVHRMEWLLCSCCRDSNIVDSESVNELDKISPGVGISLLSLLLKCLLDERLELLIRGGVRCHTARRHVCGVDIAGLRGDVDRGVLLVRVQKILNRDVEHDILLADRCASQLGDENVAVCIGARANPVRGNLCSDSPGHVHVKEILHVGEILRAKLLEAMLSKLAYAGGERLLCRSLGVRPGGADLRTRGKESELVHLRRLMRCWGLAVLDEMKYRKNINKYNFC